MKFKLRIGKLADVPEGHRNFYQADGDGFRLKDEIEIPDGEDTTGLKNNRDSILAEKNTLEQKFAGIDPEKARKALQFVEEQERKRLEATGQFEALKKSLEESHQTAITGLNQKLSRVSSQLQAQMVDSAVTQAFVSAGGKRLKLILPEGGGGPVRSRVKVVEQPADSGQYVIQVFDAAGNASPDSHKALSTLIGELKSSEDYGSAWDATGAGGSGAPGGKSGQGAGAGKSTLKRGDFDALDPAAKMEHVKSGGTITD